MNESNNFNFLIEPSVHFFGKAKVLGDKSISHRAIILASIAEGKTVITNALMGEDNLATLRAFNQMGVKSKIINQSTIEIEGVGLRGLKEAKDKIDLGNSGTAIRLLTGLLAGQNFKSTLVGDESIMKRPMARVADPLGSIGANITLFEKNYPPIEIKPSQLQGREVKVTIASAQVKSAILLAGMYAKGETKVCFFEPTRNHTELMMDYFGIKLSIQEKSITIQEQKENYQAKDISVVGDISSASFLIAAALMSNKQDKKLLIKNVGINPSRTSGITIMKMMGANIKIKKQTTLCNEPICDIEVSPSSLIGIEIPKNLIANAIDEIPLLMVLAAFAKGKTCLKGAKELRFKESDRIQSVVDNLRQLGIDCEEFEDGMKVEGLGDLPPPYHYQTIRLSSFNDHRVAMAFSLAGLKMKQAIEIENCKNVDTSFPNFVELMNSLGLKISKKVLNLAKS